MYLEKLQKIFDSEIPESQKGNEIIKIYSGLILDISSMPFAVMLLNYVFALPGYVYINAVTGTGKTRIAFWFQLITIVIYLFYLYLLSHYTASLAVYLTAEYLFVILLAVQSVLYLRISS